MKKNLKNKISSYGFWLSLLTVIFLVVQNVLKQFGIELSSQIVVEVIALVIFVLITFGVITNTKKDNLLDIKDDIKVEIENNSNKESEN